MNLIWFRSDLRITDNTALQAATEDKKSCHAVYVLSPAMLDAHHWSPPKLQFVRRHLQSLTESLANLGIALTVLHSKHIVGQGEDVIKFARSISATDIYANDEFGLHEQTRDQQMAALCQQQGLTFHLMADRTLLSPGSVTTQSNTPYLVYTPFSKACFTRLPQAFAIESPEAAARKLDVVEVPHFPGEGDYDLERWPTGEAQAHAKLLHFINHSIEDYNENRNRPDIEGTSDLSAYINAGVISVRHIWTQCAARDDAGSMQFKKEILWREFYQHLMALTPRLSKGCAFKEETEHLPWSKNKNDFKRWCDGQTGVPIVDAAMRCLKQTGWMHNRLRMIVASFLTKNLFIDWRWGERYFLQQLIDGDFIANNGGWQWSASTGTDAAPYFRVFNPVTQGQRFDPDGTFIRKWVLELNDEAPKTIHQTGARNGYPDCMVDLKQTRAAAIEHFKALKFFKEEKHVA